MNKDTRLPIGYYLKKADNLLTEGINKIHEELGLTRTGWQILNMINERGSVDSPTIKKLLLEFETGKKIDDFIYGLIDSGLVKEHKFLSLTDKGKEVFKICLEKQTAFRHKAMRNITDNDYEQIIATLEKLIGNLS
ncbi:MAG: hypothetical protein HGGPFJEG_01962 [Ignavibacteria bacterium]|nr:hypothetical protein [Ignavibacteria bacterium]